MSPIRLVFYVCLAACIEAACVDSHARTPLVSPRVQLLTPSTNVVGGQIEVDVQVTGCASSSQASLFDGARRIRTFALDTNPMPLFLTPQDISFRADGIAAQLSLTAQIVCDDGRTATSPPAGVQYLPVGLVVAPPSGTPSNEQVVPTFFFTDGSGDSATFVGCTLQPNGQRLLQRINQQGDALQTVDRTDVLCDDTAVFTDPGGGVRWMLVPGVGAMAFDPTLHVTSVARNQWTNPSPQAVAGNQIAINPVDGDALIYMTPNNEQPEASNLFRIRPDCLPTHCPAENGWPEGSPIVWGMEVDQGDESSPFFLLGDMQIVDGHLILLPGYGEDVVKLILHHKMAVVDYVGGGGTSSELYDAELNFPDTDIRSQLGGNFKSEDMTINPYQPALYIPFVTQSSPSFITEVRAYDDTTGQPLWGTNPVFHEEIGQVVVFGGGTRLAAIGPHDVWLLNAADGTVLNPGRPIQAHGSLYVDYVTQGSNEELIILNGPPPANTANPPPPLPGELITVPNATDGPLVTYPVQTGSLWASVDQGGGIWVRVNQSLVKLLDSSDYVALKNQ